MKISERVTRVFLALIIILSLGISFGFEFSKQGFHEDELLTYNLANSSKKLNTSGWNTPEDMLEYLVPTESNRFNYAQVYQNQIIDASHPPFYYALVHTVCSFFPNLFSKWLAFSINVIAMAVSLVLLYKIARRVCGNYLYALVAAGGYALSIACFTTTIYLRMYATLTCFVLAFLCLTLWYYDKGKEAKLVHALPFLPVVTLGVLTQYYFILFAGLTGLCFLIFKLREKQIKQLIFYVAFCLVGAGLALAIYPYIISNVLGGNRGLGSLDLSIDPITIFTYFIYKIGTYIQILSKDLFIGLPAVWVGFTIVVLGFGAYFRFVKKRKLNRKAMFVIVPALVYFIGISLVSPFNSDRYVMASLPLISMLYTFAFIKIFTHIMPENRLRNGVCMVLALIAPLAAFPRVTPYYIYGKTNLYEPVTDNCLFVGTAMLEWNKCIDKFMLYDGTMIVQTEKMSPTLANELESFANSRGVITNGKISAFADAYMNNGDVDRPESESLRVVADDEKLKGLDEITVYISRLADRESVKAFLTNEAGFKHSELICEDYSFEQFYNWYDYFVETESYCNVYRFYR